MTVSRDFVAKAKQEVVVDIGQIGAKEKRALDRAVRRGELVKWRGRWFPTAGALGGIGPLKSCWHTHNPYAGLTPAKSRA